MVKIIIKTSKSYLKREIIIRRKLVLYSKCTRVKKILLLRAMRDHCGSLPAYAEPMRVCMFLSKETLIIN